jgi:hypothetical protein
MCGIAGMSMAPNSRVNVRALAHELLSAIEYRGSHASGFAYDKDGEQGVYKDAKPGSQLPLAELPRRAKAVVLHTRFATQGAVQDNRNNHPVLSPGGNIALVHNGVISNDMDFRYGPDGFPDLPAVDTAVIPALIERDGVKDAAAALEGYAAIAFLDARDAVSNTLHLARLDFSPVAFTWLLDGSFVFASTKPLLAGALAASGLEHGHIFEMPEEDYVTVVNGINMTSASDVKMQEDWWTRQRYAGSTAGGHSSTNAYSTSIGASFGRGADAAGNVVFDDDDDDYDTDMAKRTGRGIGGWDSDYRNSSAFTTDPDEIAMAMAPEGNAPTGTRQVWLPDPETGELTLAYIANDTDLQGFYLTLEDDSIEFADTIEGLEKKLEWIASLQLWDEAPFPNASPKLRWTNFVTDIGEVTTSRGMDSWLGDLSMIDQHESSAVYNLEYIREGLADIIMHHSM